MGDLAALVGLSAEQLLAVVLALPYVGIAMGRLQPRKNVEDWRDAYYRSEANRRLESETSGKMLDYLEAADSLLRSVIAPHAPPPPTVTRDRPGRADAPQDD